MTIVPAICSTCQTPFSRRREAQRTCSPACKQALFRTEKCNNGSTIPETPEIAPHGADGRVPDGNTRLYPGTKPLSDLECRVMKLQATGDRDRRGALLYSASMNAKGPAEAATSPDRGSTNPTKD